MKPGSAKNAHDSARAAERVFVRGLKLEDMKAQRIETADTIELVPQILHLKKILVPTDFSETSKKAVQYALRFAEQFGCEIALLYVVEPTTPLIGAPLGVEVFTEKDEFSMAEKDLSALAAKSRTNGAHSVTSFVRIGHAFIVFPGGVGTAEEILYLLGILLHPDNAEIPYPLIFTGPRESAAYFEQIDRFLRLALGDEVARFYEIIVDDPAPVARHVLKGIERVRRFRLDSHDAFFFNWAIHIDEALQHPFKPTHEAMAGLNLHREQPQHQFAADLRRAFSGIVAGNVKIEGMRAIEKYGPFLIRGDDAIMQALDELLASFVVQQRMKLPGGAAYVPCYQVVRG